MERVAGGSTQLAETLWHAAREGKLRLWESGRLWSALAPVGYQVPTSDIRLFMRRLQLTRAASGATWTPALDSMIHAAADVDALVSAWHRIEDPTGWELGFALGRIHGIAGDRLGDHALACAAAAYVRAWNPAEQGFEGCERVWPARTWEQACLSAAAVPLMSSQARVRLDRVGRPLRSASPDTVVAVAINAGDPERALAVVLAGGARMLQALQDAAAAAGATQLDPPAAFVVGVGLGTLLIRDGRGVPAELDPLLGAALAVPVTASGTSRLRDVLRAMNARRCEALLLPQTGPPAWRYLDACPTPSVLDHAVAALVSLPDDAFLADPAGLDDLVEGLRRLGQPLIDRVRRVRSTPDCLYPQRIVLARLLGTDPAPNVIDPLLRFAGDSGRAVAEAGLNGLLKAQPNLVLAWFDQYEAATPRQRRGGARYLRSLRIEGSRERARRLLDSESDPEIGEILVAAASGRDAPPLLIELTALRASIRSSMRADVWRSAQRLPLESVTRPHGDLRPLRLAEAHALLRDAVLVHDSPKGLTKPEVDAALSPLMLGLDGEDIWLSTCTRPLTTAAIAPSHAAH